MNEDQVHTLIYLSTKPGTWNDTFRTDEGQFFERFKKVLPRKHVIYNGTSDLRNIKKNSVQSLRLLYDTEQSMIMTNGLEKFPFIVVNRGDTQFSGMLDKIFPDDADTSSSVEFYRWILPQVVKGGSMNNFNYTKFVNASKLTDMEKRMLINNSMVMKAFRDNKSTVRVTERARLRAKNKGDGTRELDIPSGEVRGASRSIIASLANKRVGKKVKQRIRV